MPQTLNICLVSQEFPPYTNWGGVGIQFDILARGLAARGHRVVVISRGSDGAPVFEELPFGVHVWRVGPSIARKRLLGRTLDRILFARTVADRVASLDDQVPFDIIEGAAASLDADRVAAMPRFVSRVVISCHGSNFLGQPVTGPLAWLHRWDWQWGGRRELTILARARQVVVSSQATAQFVRSLGVPPGKIAFAALGIDTDRFHPSARPRETDGLLRVGFVGRLQPSKGIDFVWKVMETLGPAAGVQFVFKGAIHPAAQAETLERLRQFSAFAEYHPPGAHEEMPEFYRSLDVLHLPSRFENFGLTYAEGLATGLLVIAGSGGAGPETVTDGVTGFVVDPDGSVEATVSRLREMAADRNCFASIRAAGRADAVHRLSLEQFIAEKERQYRTLAAAGPAQ